MDMRGTDWRAHLRTPWAVLAVWAAFCAIYLAIQPLLGWEPVGPDDWTRLLQVQAWVEGQSFWDVTQYRMNPPDGFSMHWSRLVDLPLALLIPLVGETAALAAVPLLYLLMALFALRSIMLRFDFPDMAFAAGLVILPLFPLLPGSFAPMRIDHHTPQAVLALSSIAFALSERRIAAVAAGLCAAAWVLISLEGLPLAAVLAGLYGLRYWWAGQRLLHWFLVPFVIVLAGWDSANLIAIVYYRLGPGGLYCDTINNRHIPGLLLTAFVMLVATHLPGQKSARSRFIALAVSGVVSLGLALALMDECATNPMAELDPVLQAYWHGYITEGLPIWKQPVSVALVLLWTIGIVIAGWWTAHCTGRFHQGRALPCTLYFLFAMAAGAYSLLVMREAIIAQLLAIPFAALLVAHYLPRARELGESVPRILATLAALGLTTPLFVSAFAKPIDPLFPSATMQPDIIAKIDPRPCDFSRLSGLPPGQVLSTLDAGPEILGKSDHTILAASYHRNQQPMRDVILAFTGYAGQAERIVGSSRIDYVVACASKADLALYRTAAPDNFANLLVSGDVPEWLEPVAGFEEGSLRVYRVK